MNTPANDPVIAQFLAEQSLLAEQKAADRAITNRKNAQFSTGPKTEAGRQRVRMNALQHGLYSRSRILPTEDPTEYDRISNLYYSLYEPQSDIGRELVQQLVDARWRRDRLYRAEEQVVTAAQHERAQKLEIEDPIERDETAMGQTWLHENKVISQIWRAQARTERQIEKLEKKITMLKKIGEQSFPGFVPSVSEQSTERIPEPAPQPAPAPAQTGFVPSNPPQPSSKPSLPLEILRKMPKFRGPNKQRDRKNWIRNEEKRLAAQQKAA